MSSARRKQRVSKRFPRRILVHAKCLCRFTQRETQDRSFQVLRARGKLISVVSKPDQDLAKRHGVTAAFFMVDVTTERLRKIAELIDRGELKTRVSTVLAFSDARDAHMMLERQLPSPKGKIILDVERDE